MWSSIPEDLLFAEVLPRMALRSLARFRCVSKSWRDQIDKPYFITSHINQTQYTKSTGVRIMFTNKANQHRIEDMIVFYFDVDSLNLESSEIDVKKFDLVETKFSGNLFATFGSDIDVKKIDLSPLVETKLPGNFFMFGSCNGLVSVFVNHPWMKAYNTMLLLNPFTQKWCSLPHYSKEFAADVFITSSGFGYVKNTDDYRVVTTVESRQGDSHTLIFSLRSNSWRRGEDNPFRSGKCEVWFDAGGVLAGRGLHWVIATFDERRRPTRFDILAFDLWEEKYSYVPWPWPVMNKLDFKYSHMNPLGCIRGCLSVALLDRPNKSLDLWVMTEYGVRDSWTKSTVPLDFGMGGHVTRCETPLAYFQESHTMLIQIDDGRFFLYDWRRKLSKLFRLPSSFDGAVDATVCYGSLVLPNHGCT